MGTVFAKNAHGTKLGEFFRRNSNNMRSRRDYRNYMYVKLIDTFKKSCFPQMISEIVLNHNCLVN